MRPRQISAPSRARPLSQRTIILSSKSMQSFRAQPYPQQWFRLHVLPFGSSLRDDGCGGELSGRERNEIDGLAGEGGVDRQAGRGEGDEAPPSASTAGPGLKLLSAILVRQARKPDSSLPASQRGASRQASRCGIALEQP